jgi:glycosyltransferase involved in cell wall biosynthesis
VRILFDAFWWMHGPPSGRNVVRSIVAEWLAAYPADSITLAVPRGTDAASLGLEPGGRQPAIHWSRVPQQAASAALEIGRFRDYDVVFTQNFTPIRSKALRVVFIHDVMYQEHPEWFTKPERLYLAPLTRLARGADLILTSSRAERARIARLNPRLASRVHDVGLAVPKDFHSAAAAPLRPGLRPKRFLLTVGRLTARKNLEALIHSLRQSSLISPDFPLVVVGAPDGLNGLDAAQSAATHTDVVWTGPVSDGELKGLYTACAVFVFPSLDEGFGLPALEAAACGAPIALSRIAAFEEFGYIGAFFDPTDSADIARGVREALDDPTEGFGGASSYSWESTVRKSRALISAVLGERTGSHHEKSAR